MPHNSEKDINYAKTIALKYLSHAPRSVKEVELKLGEKDIADNISGKVIGHLISLGYLNDEIFARQWASSKIKSRLWGRNKIIHGLKQKGISNEIINQTVMDVYQPPAEERQEDKNSITEATELNTAKIALWKWLKSKNHGAKTNCELRITNYELNSAIRNRKSKIVQKAFRHLQAKGFPTSIAIAAIKECFGKLETDEDQ
ncbi:MAG: RecX family transcriptional regulator [Deltaproteobacteria bacterium]|nr:RecX family transcriptional regulator [Deltaproteobacteria bacterium]